jgi:putative component of membrane protein insertase Oxa1/YidC/SpoIIIJ protein YidD
MNDSAVIVILAGLLCWSGSVVAQAETNGTAEPMMWQNIYQATLGKADGDRCPMSPSCSAYAAQAIRKHGWLVGWMMTFDRFAHEGTEAQQTANGVRYRDGKLKAVDEIEHNDFWWAKNDRETSGDFISAGHSDVASRASRLPQQAAASSDDDMRQTGTTLLRIGSSSEASILFIALWNRSKAPADVFFGALALLESNQPAACAALMEALLNTADVDNDAKTIGYFAQGLAFRKRGLFDAAAQAFAAARDLAQDASVSAIPRAYYVEAKLKADRWTDAAQAIESLDTSAAKSIRREIAEDLPWRSPALSGTMSAILPGSGQVYCGRYQEGFWAFVVCGVFAFASYEAFDHDLEWVGAATTLTGLSWYSGNVYGAIGAAHKYNQREKDKRIANWIERLGVQPGNDGLKVMLKFEF